MPDSVVLEPLARHLEVAVMLLQIDQILPVEQHMRHYRRLFVKVSI